jgi:isoleucyl-tRNA synthetase
MYQELCRYYDAEALLSVHLCDFPVSNTAAAANDRQLLHSMDSVLELVEQGHAARNKAGLKVRQPLAEMRVEAAEKDLSDQMRAFVPLILDELNIKKVTFVESLVDLYDLSVRLDAKTGKPKFGRLFDPLQDMISKMPAETVAAQVREGQGLDMQVSGENVHLSLDELTIAKTARKPWEISEGNGFLVAINTELDSHLIREGRVRDLVRHIQNLRKEIGLDVADRIRIAYYASDELAAAISAHSDYLAGETLALAITRKEEPPAAAREIKLGSESLQVSIEKA